MNTRRRPLALPILAFCVMLPALIWLGSWQLDRYEARKQALTQLAAQSAPLSYEQVSQDGSDYFANVEIRGRYQSTRQILIDNMTYQSRNGFYVITPFETLTPSGEPGPIILVNRGWVPQSAQREPTLALDIASKDVTLNGRVGKLPVAGISLGQAAAPSTWPARMQFPNIEQIESLLSTPLPTWVLLLEGEHEDGLVRDWQAGGLPAERHLGYALQWFALAIALIILAVVGYRKRERT